MNRLILWEKLPSVISCCFCCFLRAGTVLIAIISFAIGLIFAPNVNHTPGFWAMEGVLSNYSAATEGAIQMAMGIIAILLCVASGFLLVGSLCNCPVFIEIYQWGALLHMMVNVMLYMILSAFCFFVHANCTLAGCILLGLIVCHLLVTAYFIIVTNSLRNSVVYLKAGDFIA